MTSADDPIDSAPGWAENPIAFLIGADASGRFFDTHYEQAPLLARHGDPTRFADLLSVEQVDAFLNGADLRRGMVDLAGDAAPPPGDYVNDGDRIVTPVVMEAYHAGATIILPSLHDSLPGLGRFCRALEAALSCRVQTNIYLTPANAQGFRTHYDTHDVFVLQIAGAKRWRLYAEPAPTPFRGEGFDAAAHPAGDLADEFELAPGDCVYVPRGWQHDAPNRGGAPSLHITVGLLTRTWADLMLEAVSEVALAEPALRRSLPPGYARRDFDRGAAAARFAELAALIGAKVRMDNAFEAIGDDFLRGTRPDLAGVIAAPFPAGRYRARPVAGWRLAADGEALVLIGPGGDIGFAADDAPALERALGGAAFAAADLDHADPERLIRALWANGYLEIAGRPLTGR